MKTDGAPLFESLPSPERHISRLEVVATILGLDPAPSKKCRVLELACGTGSNLIPQADAYSNSEFLGIDLCSDQLEFGQDAIKELGLKNIELRSEDILKFADSDKKYDYIICHGLFSWSSNEVREAILRICSESLAEHGVAYVSFNALPGWFARGKIREKILGADNPDGDLSDRIEAAREKLVEIEEAFGEHLLPLEEQMKKEISHLKNQSDAFFRYEMLGEECQPFHIRKFCSMARENGLRYLGDGHPGRIRFWRYDVEDAMQGQPLSSDPRPDKEQEMDHKYPITFRGTLLCRDSHDLPEDPNWQAVKSYFLASPLVPLNERPDIHSEALEIFRGAGEVTVELEEPFLKSVLVYFRSTWPETVPFKEIVSEAAQLCGQSEDRSDWLANTLIEYFMANLVEFFPEKLPCERQIQEKPKAPAFARYQARHGSPWVTTLRHEYGPLDDFSREVLLFLDGSLTQEEIVQKLVAIVSEGELKPTVDGKEITDPDEIAKLAKDALERTLHYFAEHGLLQSS